MVKSAIALDRAALRALVSECWGGDIDETIEMFLDRMSDTALRSAAPILVRDFVRNIVRVASVMKNGTHNSESPDESSAAQARRRVTQDDRIERLLAARVAIPNGKGKFKETTFGELNRDGCLLVAAYREDQSRQNAEAVLRFRRMAALLGRRQILNDVPRADIWAAW